MKIYAPCFDCVRESGPSAIMLHGIGVADYYDDGVAHVECPNGHKYAVILQSQKFEILLESGANALIDGYTIEAASSFAAAYERFLEFAIQVFCKKLKIDELELEKTFGTVSKQSERQLGGFLFLYLIVFGKHYLINHKRVEKRNKTIHQGYIPTPDEVLEFGDMVYDEIYSVVQQMKAVCSNEIMGVIHDNLQKKNHKLATDIRGVTTAGVSFFSLAHAKQKKDFKTAMQTHRFSRKMFDLANSKMRAVSEAIKNNDFAKAKEIFHAIPEVTDIELPPREVD